MLDFHGVSSFGSSPVGLALQVFGLAGLMLSAFAAGRAHLRWVGQNHAQDMSWRWGCLALASTVLFAGVHG